MFRLNARREKIAKANPARNNSKILRHLLVGEALEKRLALAVFAVDTLVDENDGSYVAGDLSLREAVLRANTQAGADQIVFAPHLQGGTIRIKNALGPINVTSDLSITAQQMTLDGRTFNSQTGAVRTQIMTIGQAANATTVSIEGVSFVNGLSVNGGGAISTRNTNLTINNCTFTGNEADHGGAIEILSGNVNIGTTDFARGLAGFGGAISHADGTLTLNRSRIVDNSVFGEGGGIYQHSGVVRVLASTFTGNFAGGNSAAAINLNGDLEFYDSTIARNSAPNSIGAVWNIKNLLMVNCTVAENTSKSGANPPVGAVDSIGDSMRLYNTIIAGNLGGVDLTGQASVDCSNNLVFNTQSLTNGMNGNIVGVAQFGDTLQPLAANGGRTLTYIPVPASPAIDAGSNVLALGPDGMPLTTDQRGQGFSRQLDGDLDGTATVDIGSVEAAAFTGPLVVDWLLDDFGDHSFAPSRRSLREAVAIANFRRGKDTITFAPELFTQGPNQLEMFDDLAINEDLSIQGPGSALLEFDAGGFDRFFNVGLNNELNLSGITLTNGYAKQGGAIYNLGRKLTLNDVTATNNLAVQDPNLPGLNTEGAVIHSPEFDFDGNPILVDQIVEVTNSKFLNNVSENFAGVFRMFQGDTLSIRNSVFANNAANNGGVTAAAGGVIEVYDSLFLGNESSNFGGALRTFGDLTVVRSSFVGNTAIDEGGGAIGFGGADKTLRVISSTFSGNAAKLDGGAIFATQFITDGAITNCTIINNQSVDEFNNDGILNGGGLGGGADFKIVNSIISDNLVANLPGEIQPGSVDLASSFNNIVRNANTAGGLQNGVSGNKIGVNPQLDPLTSVGHRYFAIPKAASPALNAGNTLLAVDQHGIPHSRDQRGTGFAGIFGPAVDIGSIEMQPASVVTLAFKVLHVNGTPAADLIGINDNGVSVNGVQYGFSPEEIIAISVFGNDGNDHIAVNSVPPGVTVTLDGGAGNDTLIGGINNDTLTGGAGNDVYVFDTDGAFGGLGTDTINEAGGGNDTFDFTPTTSRVVKYDLGLSTSQVVNAGLTVVLAAGSVIENLTGGSLGDMLTGSSSSNVLTGNGGNDTLNGAGGNDRYVFDTDSALGTDILLDSAGTDTIDFRNTTTRNLTVNLGSATAQVINLGLTLTLPGANAIENIIGGALDDVLTGNSLANVMTGGAGNDRYIFDTDDTLSNDTIDESGGGDDTLDFSSTTTRTVAVNLANSAAQIINAGLTLTLSSTTSVENVIGGQLADSLTGNSVANRFSGLGGNDTMVGGAGDDTYQFDTDNALGSDTINEAGGGTDTLDFSSTTTRTITVNLATAVAQAVNAGLTLTLSANNTLENVIGGALADTLTGNALANTFSGGAGNDTMTGGAGHDRYLFDTDLALGSDVLNEAGGGTDHLDFSPTTTRVVAIDLSTAMAQVVNTGLTLTLSANNTFEQATGGALGDSLTGNGLANTLAGGLGNDVYNFDTDLALGSDTISEAGGVDTLNFASTSTRAVFIDLANAAAQVVNAGLTLTLSSSSTVENALGGSLADTISGNALANVLTGNGGNDTINGAAGQDILLGGLGADILTGGNGEDLLLGGTTSHDGSAVALLALLSEWGRTDQTYAQRIGHLSAASGGNNGSTLLNAASVQNDANSIDQLTGGSPNLDWFFVSLGDVLVDALVTETKTPI